MVMTSGAVTGINDDLGLTVDSSGPIDTPQSNINVGDVVEMISGGPKMTVSKVDGDTAFCIWFEKLPGQNWNGPFKENIRLAAIRKVEA